MPAEEKFLFSLRKQLDASETRRYYVRNKDKQGCRIMDYYESAEGMTISKERAKKEIKKHGSSWSEFLLDNPEKDEYDAQEVLAWLGY